MFFDKLYSLVYTSQERVKDPKENMRAKVRNIMLSTLVFFLSFIPTLIFCPTGIVIGISAPIFISLVAQMFYPITHQKSPWLVAYPQRFFLMTLAWIEDAITSPFRSLYYLGKHIFFPKKEDLDSIAERRAAYGSFLGALVPGLAVTLMCLLIFNPFTGLPLLGTVAAIATTVIVGTLIAKTCEFLGKLSGNLRTKALADQEINRFELYRDRVKQDYLHSIKTACTIEYVDSDKNLQELVQTRRVNNQEVPDYFVKEDQNDIKRYIPYFVPSEEESKEKISIVPSYKLQKDNNTIQNYMKNKIKRNEIVNLNEWEAYQLGLSQHSPVKEEKVSPTHLYLNSTLSDNVIKKLTLKDMFIARQTKGKKIGSSIMDHKNIPSILRKKTSPLDTLQGRFNFLTQYIKKREEDDTIFENYKREQVTQKNLKDDHYFPPEIANLVTLLLPG